MKKYLEVGKAVTTQGLNGELKLYPWCDSAETLKKIKKLYADQNGQVEYELETVKLIKNMNIIKLKGVDSIEDARKFIEKVFYVDRNDLKLPEGRFFVCDLIGLEVFDADSDEHYGAIEDVTNNGAHDVYHVKLANGEIRFVPAVTQFIVKTDIEGLRLDIRPIKGMMSDED